MPSASKSRPVQAGPTGEEEKKDGPHATHATVFDGVRYRSALTRGARASGRPAGRRTWGVGVAAEAGADHKARQPRPIALGVSGGNATDTANGFCCSGTLGALVQNGQGQFILSNSHVFAHDVQGGERTSRRSATPSTSQGSSTSPVRTGPTTTSPPSRRCRRSTLDSLPPSTRRSRPSRPGRFGPTARFSRSAKSAPRRPTPFSASA